MLIAVITFRQIIWISGLSTSASLISTYYQHEPVVKSVSYEVINMALITLSTDNFYVFNS